MRYTLLNKNEYNTELVASNECLAFDSYSEANAFVLQHKDFELRIAEYSCHHPNEGWKLGSKAYEALGVCEEWYGDNYQIFTDEDDASDYIKETLKALVEDASLEDIFSYIRKAECFIDNINLLGEEEGLLVKDGYLENTQTITVKDCSFFDDLDGHYTRIVAVRKEN